MESKDPTTRQNFEHPVRGFVRTSSRGRGMVAYPYELQFAIALAKIEILDMLCILGEDAESLTRSQFRAAVRVPSSKPRSIS